MSQKRARSRDQDSVESDIETTDYDDNESDVQGETTEEELFSDSDNLESEDDYHKDK